MSKKILAFLIVTMLFIFVYFEVNASERAVLASSSNILSGSLYEVDSSNQYYVPEHWTTREQDVQTYSRTMIYEDYFKRYRPLFYWNYHRIRAYEDGYSDLYVTSKVSGFLTNGGSSVFTVSGSTEISSTKSHTFEFAPEVKDIKLGGYSYTSSSTVVNILGASWSLTVGPNSPAGYYGFYTISHRSRYSIYHMYSKSSQEYNLTYNVYENIYMFDSNKPDITFLFTGSKSLA